MPEPYTARDICPNCGHTWDQHTEGNAPVTQHPSWPLRDDEPCGCCLRIAAKVKELNDA